jgi:tetratricopeptide (TPR) repeat protein
MAVHEPMALEIFEDLGDLSGITLLSINLGVQAYADGNWDEAIAYYSRAQEVSRRSGNIYYEGAAAANLGEVLISRGRLEEAETILEEARRVLRGQKDVRFALLAEIQLGRLIMERGEHQTALTALSRVIEEARRAGHPLAAVDAAVHLADACTRSGDPGRALQVIAQARELAGEEAVLYEVPLGRMQAQALLAMDRPDEALVEVKTALASAREQRLVYEVALLLLLLVQAQTGANGEVLEEAEDLLQHLGAPPYFARNPSPVL